MYCNTFSDSQEKLLNSNHCNFISTVEAGWCQWKNLNALASRTKERESMRDGENRICYNLSFPVGFNNADDTKTFENLLGIFIKLNTQWVVAELANNEIKCEILTKIPINTQREIR